MTPLTGSEAHCAHRLFHCNQFKIEVTAVRSKIEQNQLVGDGSGWFCSSLTGKAHETRVVSKTETDNISRQVLSEDFSCSSFLTMAINTQVAMAHQICVFTPDSLVPKNFFDVQILLDPLDEQFDLPAVLVKLGNHRRGQRRVVGQKHPCFARLIFQPNPTQMLGIVFGGLESIERHTRPKGARHQAN